MRGDLIDGLIGQHYLSHWLPERMSETAHRFAYETASRMALRSGNLSHAHRVARKISREEAAKKGIVKANKRKMKIEGKEVVYGRIGVMWNIPLVCPRRTG
jgi:hypothetical protein